MNELCIALTAHHRTTIYVNGPIGARMPSVIREVSDPMARALLLHMLIASSCATLTLHSAPATDETEPSHDAFGSRIGVESLGLYSESRFQTRNENHGAILTSTDADNGWGFSSMKVNCERGQRGRAQTDTFDGDFGVAERYGVCSRQRSRVPYALGEGPRR